MAQGRGVGGFNKSCIVCTCPSKLVRVYYSIASSIVNNYCGEILQSRKKQPRYTIRDLSFSVTLAGVRASPGFAERRRSCPPRWWARRRFSARRSCCQVQREAPHLVQRYPPHKLAFQLWPMKAQVIDIFTILIFIRSTPLWCT